MSTNADGQRTVRAWFEGGSLGGTEKWLPLVEHALPDDDESLPYKNPANADLLFPVSWYPHGEEMYMRLTGDVDSGWHYKLHPAR